MESMQLSVARGPELHAHLGVEKSVGGDVRNQAEEMKSIQRAKLRRMVNADPSMAGKLVALEASPVYNASGNLIQTVGRDLATV